MYRSILFGLLCSSLVWALPWPKKQYLPVKSKSPRIVNGEQAALGQFPWQAALFISHTNATWFCGGSILNERWVLTAAHCAEGGETGEIYTGGTNPYEGYITWILQFIPHEDFSYDGENLKNDIALLGAAWPITFDAYTAPIRLSSDFLDAGSLVTVSGFGITSDDAATISDRLNFVHLYTITNAECSAYYGEGTIGDEMVCTVSNTEEPRGTCSGDSGGGLVLNADTDPELAGVVSFTSDQGCETGAPDGFTRVVHYREWIRAHTGL